MYQDKKVEIMESEQMNWHIDGEPLTMKGPVTIQLEKCSLKVVGK
jgi:hypothetical protein